MKPVTFRLIDMDAFPRKEHFHHYMNNSNCTYSMTVDVDITDLYQTAKQGGFKLTPALTFMTAKAVNQCEALRYALDEEGRLGIWSHLEVCYPIFHNDDKTFTYLTTPMEDSFHAYYEAVRRDIAQLGDTRGIYATTPPENCFSVSAIPWVHFTGFNLNILTDGKYLTPIITWGQFHLENKRILLPLSIQVHHAATDGWHVAEFLNILGKLSTEAPTWMQE